MTPHQHFCTLADELTKNTKLINKTPKGRRLLRLLGNQIDKLLAPLPTSVKQGVAEVSQCNARKAEQRMINVSSIITIP
jgi:hypothetical protein